MVKYKPGLQNKIALTIMFWMNGLEDAVSAFISAVRNELLTCSIATERGESRPQREHFHLMCLVLEPFCSEYSWVN